MKMKKISIGIIAALFIMSLTTVAFAVADTDIDLSKEYHKTYSGWSKMDYVTGTSVPGSDAAAQTQTNVAYGMFVQSGVKIKTSIDTDFQRKVCSDDTGEISGWYSTGYINGLLNGTKQDDVAVRVYHYSSRYFLSKGESSKEKIERMFV